MNDAITDARLSWGVYQDHLNRIADWGRIEFSHAPSGLQWALYERRLPNDEREWKLVFAGTQNLVDWATNADQAFVTGLIDYVLTPAQYREALEVARHFIEIKDRAAGGGGALGRKRQRAGREHPASLWSLCCRSCSPESRVPSPACPATDDPRQLPAHCGQRQLAERKYDG